MNIWFNYMHQVQSGILLNDYANIFNDIVSNNFIFNGYSGYSIYLEKGANSKVKKYVLNYPYLIT